MTCISYYNHIKVRFVITHDEHNFKCSLGIVVINHPCTNSILTILITDGRGIKPVLEPVLVKFYDSIWLHQGPIMYPDRYYFI